MQVQIGIDWSEAKHDVMAIDETGRPLNHQVIEHSESGFKALESWRASMGIAHDECRIGLETAHNLLIDHLWRAGYTAIYVIPPNVVNASRPRYSQSGARNDKSDAYLIADLLRTDSHRFYPWHPGSELLQQMRMMASLAQFWTKETVALSNRLRNCLLRYHPAVLDVFSWPSPIACHLILAYPSPADLSGLTFGAFQAFLSAHHHTRTAKWLTCYDALTAPSPTATAGIAQACQVQAQQLAQLVLAAMSAKKETLAQLNALFQQHDDAHIFASLPGAGELLAPSLLVKFGEDRNRFPKPALLQALAGTAPVTKQSGTKKTTHFRRACDKEFRYFSQQFARASCKQSAWAAAYFAQARQRGHSTSRAHRALANRWLTILWKMWHDRTPYDEAFHIRQRQQRRQPLA